MHAIERTVSPKAERNAPEHIELANVQETPLISYIYSRLRGDNLQVFALIFAEAIKNDRHAKIIPFENIYKFLDYERYDHAVRQL